MVCFTRSFTVCQDLQVITEAHLNPVGADNKSMKVTLVCTSLLGYGHLESCASDPTAPRASLNYPVTDRELYCNIDACRGSGSLGRLAEWCLVFSGVLCTCSRSIVAVAPPASLGTACWAVPVPAVLPYLSPCTALHPISLLQHPQLSAGTSQSVAT